MGVSVPFWRSCWSAPVCASSSLRIIWDNRIIWGNDVDESVVWRDRIIWRNRVIWGNLAALPLPATTVLGN